MKEFLAIAFEVVVILGLVATNGFFVAAEFALVKVRASQLRPLTKTGGWRVRFALKATENLGAALSATQLGITLTSLGLGWIGEPYVAHRLEPLLARVGIANATTVNSISFALAFGLITFFHIVIGELGQSDQTSQDTFRCPCYRPAIASGRSTSSSCSRVSQPRSSTISVTPRPVASASLATPVAFS